MTATYIAPAPFKHKCSVISDPFTIKMVDSAPLRTLRQKEILEWL